MTARELAELRSRGGVASVAVTAGSSGTLAVAVTLLVSNSDALDRIVIAVAALMICVIAGYRMFPRFWGSQSVEPVLHAAAPGLPMSPAMAAAVNEMTILEDPTPRFGIVAPLPLTGPETRQVDDDDLDRVGEAPDDPIDAPPSWKILLSPPEVGLRERDLLLAAFDSNWVAPAGPDIDAFEAELAELTGAPDVAALSSGSAALHLALLAVGVKPGDDVLVSTLTFGASAFAVTYAGARPCFIDCDESTWHLDEDLLDAELARRARRGRQVAAVVAVDLYGSVTDGKRLAEICERHEVPLVQDSAQAVGAFRDGVHAGRWGSVGVLSFNGNKMVTTGGGGALLSDDVSIVSRARHLSTQARQPVPWYEHDDIGFNYRMGNLNAAVGRGQLRTLATRIAGRRRVRAEYERHLGQLPGVRFHQLPDGCSPNYWLTTVTIDAAEFGATPRMVLTTLRNAGIEGRNVFNPMHRQPVFADNPRVGGHVADQIFDRGVSLPSGSRITDDEVRWICDVFSSAAR